MQYDFCPLGFIMQHPLRCHGNVVMISQDEATRGVFVLANLTVHWAPVQLPLFLFSL
jgi:hypothetical protein